MAEAFLYELLQMRNSVHNPEERCTICLEGYGTLSRETGNIEVEIRLPCTHTVGSACIATWLRSNNTCPVCRHEFFPAQPRPYLEYGIMDGEEDEEREEEDEARSIRWLNEDHCDELGLAIESCLFSGLIIERLMESPNWDRGHTEHCIVAVSIYIASHLTCEPRSPREIAAVTGVEADHIRFTYDLIYPERELLAGPRLRNLLARAFDDMGALNWPAPGYRFTDEQIESNHVSQMLKEGCEDGCDELGLDTRVAGFSNRIAENLRTAGFMAHLSPRSLTAVGIFMASHAVGRPVTAGCVSEAVGIDEVVVRSAYALAHVNRYELLGESLLEDIGRGYGESILGRLPSPSALT